MSDVLASTEARSKLPSLIADLVDHPAQVVELGRQRRREVILVSAERYDQLVEHEDQTRDAAWALFAAERIADPTSAPISWEEAQARRQRA